MDCLGWKEAPKTKTEEKVMADHNDKKKSPSLVEQAIEGLKAFGKRKFKEFTKGRDTSTIDKVVKGAISIQELLARGQKKKKKKDKK